MYLFLGKTNQITHEWQGQRLEPLIYIYIYISLLVVVCLFAIKSILQNSLKYIFYWHIINIGFRILKYEFKSIFKCSIGYLCNINVWIHSEMLKNFFNPLSPKHISFPGTAALPTPLAFSTCLVCFRFK